MKCGPGRKSSGNGWGARATSPLATKVGAGNTELQLLQVDVTEEAAYRMVKLIEYCGWHQTHPAAKGVPPLGLWFLKDCAVVGDGVVILPDGDGIIWHEGIGYAPSQKGRELEFCHGVPALNIGEELPAVDLAGWEPTSALLCAPEREMAANVTRELSGFFRDTCRRFADTAGGMGGWMAVGAMLGCAAGPEFFEHYGCLPGLFLPGQMGSGKTLVANWLIGLQGYLGNVKGLGLASPRTTAVGMCSQLENYSSLCLWMDEHRSYQITEEKTSILRDAYNRQLANKWTPDGVQRVIRTTPLVSGETDTADAATFSRYMHLQISAAARTENPALNHVDWMRDHRPYFYVFWRHLLMHRPEFVTRMMKLAAEWFVADDTRKIPDRTRVTFALGYVAFVAASEIFESHSAGEVAAFRKFICTQAAASNVDVQADVNVNVFIQDLITAFKVGAIPHEFFRLEGVAQSADPETGLSWTKYKLFLEPRSCINALEMHLRKANDKVMLNYKDMRDQLSRQPFWITALNPTQPLKKSFGKKGTTTQSTAWGIDVDLHPLGRQIVPKAELLAALRKDPHTGELEMVFRDGDPRCGPLFSIIERILESERNRA